MQVWQHLNNMDHLRRSAESKIAASSGAKSASAASYADHPIAQESYKLEMQHALQDTPALVGMSE